MSDIHADIISYFYASIMQHDGFKYNHSRLVYVVFIYVNSPVKRNASGALQAAWIVLESGDL